MNVLDELKLFLVMLPGLLSEVINVEVDRRRTGDIIKVKKSACETFDASWLRRRCFCPENKGTFHSIKGQYGCFEKKKIVSDCDTTKDLPLLRNKGTFWKSDKTVAEDLTHRPYTGSYICNNSAIWLNNMNLQYLKVEVHYEVTWDEKVIFYIYRTNFNDKTYLERFKNIKGFVITLKASCLELDDTCVILKVAGNYTYNIDTEPSTLLPITTLMKTTEPDRPTITTTTTTTTTTVSTHAKIITQKSTQIITTLPDSILSVSTSPISVLPHTTSPKSMISTTGLPLTLNPGTTSPTTYYTSATDNISKIDRNIIIGISCSIGFILLLIVIFMIRRLKHKETKKSPTCIMNAIYEDVNPSLNIQNENSYSTPEYACCEDVRGTSGVSVAEAKDNENMYNSLVLQENIEGEYEELAFSTKEEIHSSDPINEPVYLETEPECTPNLPKHVEDERIYVETEPEYATTGTEYTSAFKK
ncbi:uncharacterized protein LOC130623867 [Hydractinia symbiolongicarpus]|uniref:uncharacterized protein LOC130623867 n=1 Tax=Hydractinia symbiolongicarpus TaxID=13093 RepID=UPI00254A971F|nr:uncharacterized protein LOC130623867 [Hydractinia symbiolongicarpus]